jgi:hypothetical protein
MQRADCPSRDVLGAFAIGRLTENSREEVAAHLEQCQHCLAELSTVDAPPDTLASALRLGPEASQYGSRPLLGLRLSVVSGAPSRDRSTSARSAITAW